MARDSGLKIACFNNLGAAVSLNTIAPEWVRQVTKPVQTGFTAQCGATSTLRRYNVRSKSNCHVNFFTFITGLSSLLQRAHR